MSEHRDDDKPVDLPFDSERERIDFEWLVARDADPSTPAPSPEVARLYARIESSLASIPAAANDPSWQAEILRRAEQAHAASVQQRWWKLKPLQWGMISGGLLSLAVLVIVLAWPAKVYGVEYSVERNGKPRSRSDRGKAGELIHVPLPNADGELRVFGPGTELAAMCPSGPKCTTTSAGLHVDLELIQGQYTLELTPHATHIASEATLEVYLEQLEASGVSRKESSITVEDH